MKFPKANKDLGQHFLIDQLVIDNITSDHINECTNILEIGPGPGILTKDLKRKNIKHKKFWVIEKDSRFIEHLKLYIKEDFLIITDALKYDFNHIQLENTWLVSNLPYNISAPLTIKFLQIEKLNFLTLMYQKEVGEKIAPIQNKKNIMGSLYALTQTYFECKSICNVPPESFSPPPRVNSIVISFIRRKTPSIKLDDFKDFEKFLRKFFSQKRKQIKKVMMPFIDKEKLLFILKEINKTGTERSETFTLNEVQEFYKLQRG